MLINFIIFVFLLFITGSQASAQAPAEYVKPATRNSQQSTKISCAELTDQWKKRPSSAKFKFVAIEFKLSAEGTIDDANFSPRIYKTSGSPDIDAYAIQCIKKAAPYKFTEQQKDILGYPTSATLAKLSDNDTAFITRKIGINYRYFAFQLESSIFAPWMQLPRTKSFHTACQLVVRPDGTITNVEVLKFSDNKNIDLACMNMVSRLKQLQPPPAASQDNLPVKIVFDYDKKTNVGKNEIWVDGELINTVGKTEANPHTRSSSATESMDQYLNRAANALFDVDTDSVQTGAWMAKVSRAIKLHSTIFEAGTNYFKIKTKFKVLPDGSILNPKIIQSFNSNPKRDGDALKAILAASPLPPPVLKTNDRIVDVEFTFENGQPKPKYRLDGFHPRFPGVSVISKEEEKQTIEDLLMAGYLVQLKNKIQSHWLRDESWLENETVAIDLNKDGTVKNFHLKFVTGQNEQDRAIIDAVKAAQPFEPLPEDVQDSYSATIKFFPLPVPQPLIRHPVSE